MELTRIEDRASRRVLLTAWIAWWACAVSWFIGLVRLGSYFFSNLSSGDGTSAPAGAYGLVYDGGFIAVSASTALALAFVVLLGFRTRRGGRLAVAVILLIVGGVLFAYFREFAAWMIAAKGLFAFTPRMVKLDAVYTVMTILILLFAEPTYFGQALVALALVLTAVFLVIAARRWRAVERIDEAVSAAGSR